MNISQILTKLKSLVYSKTETDNLLGNKAASSHTHTKSQITDFPAYGSTAGTICQGNDSRLSDARTPYFANGTWYAVGDDAAIGDHNVGGGLGVKALNDTTTRIDLCYKDDASNYKSITYDGTTLYLNGNCDYATSAGSCNYANSAGSSSITTRDSGGSWISGRDNAVVKQTRHSTEDGNSWNPAVSVKTKNGNWTIGTVGYDKLQFSYDTDEDYNTGNNRSIIVELNPESGTIITSANIGSQSVNYANSAGSVSWGNVSGRPWAVSQFSNDSGYITTDGAAYPRRVGGVTMNFNWSGQGGQPTWLWGGEDGTNMYVYNPANFSVNHANSAGSATNATYTDWLRTSSHADHLFHTEWDGSYFWTYVTAGDGGYRAVRVERSNSSGWADSAGGVAWGNVSDRPTIPTKVSQLTNDNRYTEVLTANTISWDWGRTYPDKVGIRIDTSWMGGILTTANTSLQSDGRLKNTITNIDDSLLDAWENIEPKQYKFNDASEKKGEQARFHTGYIAQDIEKACADNNIDATRYGLFCFNSWDEQPEVTEDVEVEMGGVKTTETRIVQEKRAKGDIYSLRYEEALVVECAYLRRENSRMKEKLVSLEERLEKLEKAENS